MQPLLDFRDWLKATQDPDVKPGQREFKGRDGTVKIRESGKLLYRTYKLDFSKHMLRRLLETQQKIWEQQPDYEELISKAELHRIRQLWINERQDWEDSLPGIYEDVTGERLNWHRDDMSKPGQVEAEVLSNVADEHDIPENLLRKLIDTEWQHHGMRRRGTIHKDIARILGEDWRTEEEVKAEAERKKAEYNAEPVAT